MVLGPSVVPRSLANGCDLTSSDPDSPGFLGSRPLRRALLHGRWGNPAYQEAVALSEQITGLPGDGDCDDFPFGAGSRAYIPVCRSLSRDRLYRRSASGRRQRIPDQRASVRLPE